jgi:type I restriction enzyme M protein
MIHRFRVQNFKSLIDVTVELSPVTVLVGRSGTGKSNFVHAVRFLRDLLSSNQQPHDLQQKWNQIRPAIMSDGPTRFEVKFQLAGMEEKFLYILSLGKNDGEILPLEEHLCLGEKCLFHRVANIKRLNRLEWVVSPELVQVPNFNGIALGQIPSIPEIVVAFTALSSGIGCYSFSDNVLSDGTQNQLTTGLDDKATNFLNILREILIDLQNLEIPNSMVGTLQRVNPSVSSIALNDIFHPTHVIVGHKFNGKTLPLQLSQESDGFRRFYAHLLALYQRPSKQTLLFEHPEDGIHPGALSLLAEEFKAAPEQGRGQVILTTHSPKLLDQFDAEQIRVVELDGFATRIGPLSSEQREALQDKLLDAGELLTVDPARIQKEAAGA